MDFLTRFNCSAQTLYPAKIFAGTVASADTLLYNFSYEQNRILAVRIRDALAEIEHVQRRIQTARKVFGNVG